MNAILILALLVPGPGSELSVDLGYWTGRTTGEPEGTNGKYVPLRKTVTVIGVSSWDGKTYLECVEDVRYRDEFHALLINDRRILKVVKLKPGSLQEVDPNVEIRHEPPERETKKGKR